MTEAAETRIVRAFFDLAGRRGIDGTTTREIARRAAVNEVTLFRQFGDKAGLTREALRRLMPVGLIEAYPAEVDASTPERAAGDLVACLRFLRDLIRDRPEVLAFALGECLRHPELAAEIAPTPRAAKVLLERALLTAAPQLRPEVDPTAAVLCLQGLVFMTGLWHQTGMVTLPEAEWDALLAAAVRPLIAWETGGAK
ncbi:MAG: TetR/AcrR family transcriptional regulator [Candidatus Dormibacter sp.]|uniref:TetR/AcrR family transcriptional regulator n=1 Tax=Candidatus Dormibacter sp. TaxID=2973982 RepID=UPI0026AE7494